MSPKSSGGRSGVVALSRVAVGLIAVAATGCAWLVVATGVRAVAITEAQRAADAAALAGAAALVSNPDNPAMARDAAIQYARMNPVLGSVPDLTARDVEVNVDSGRVRVRVHVRVYDFPNIAARLLGVDRVTVTADATAEALAPNLSGGGPAIFKRLRLIE